MIETKYRLPLLLLVCILIGILCSIVGACITRNTAEAATKQECKIINVSNVGSYDTALIACPERGYRCFRYTHSSSISCVPAGNSLWKYKRSWGKPRSS
jgi:hypothetical protein